ncbi:hypothetical protein [Enteractinococcus coprophilus]|uniref:hypothetical protein n=1 Tax=Enteractinococcus coprophilus TaxID=1027633 RepID=UPI00114EB834|nr:hypothetical protein [Enteractinococcus coprophilus]
MVDIGGLLAGLLGAADDEPGAVTVGFDGAVGVGVRPGDVWEGPGVGRPEVGVVSGSVGLDGVVGSIVSVGVGSGGVGSAVVDGAVSIHSPVNEAFCHSSMPTVLPESGRSMTIELS